MLSFALLLSLAIHSEAQVFVVDPKLPHQPIGSHTEYYLDKSTHVAITEFLTAPSQFNFTKSNHETLNFGPTKSACWIRFSYMLSDTLQRFLAIGNSNLNEIDVFVVRNGEVLQTMQGGLSRSALASSNDLDLNSWLFELPSKSPGNTFQIYLRVVDARRVIVPIEITLLKQEINESHREDFLFGLYFGSLAIIAVLNFYFFFYFRENIYLFYGGHILCQIIINGIIQGYFLTLFGASSYFISPYVPAFAGLSNVFVILFAVTFLDVKASLKSWYKPTMMLIALPLLNASLNVSGLFTFSANAGTYVGILVCVWLFAIGLISYSRNVMQARFYIIGWGAFFIGILIVNSALNQWIEVNPFTFNAALFGTLCEVLLISFALADRINLIRIDREGERQQRLELIERQKTWLEENVKARTLELVQKTKEVEVQNQELRQQHEELASTHELLEKQKLLVEEKNRDIGIINQNLETKVKQRTFELEQSIKNLLRQNHDLEQFSYIVSHNMRAPVARILGIIELLGIEQPRDERDQLMQYLKDSAVGLDEIIHDLSRIVDLRRSSDLAMEWVDLEKIVQHILSDLTDEIRRANACVKVSLEVKEIFSVKGYLQSIIYNLISNAIKYRDPERPLSIGIKTTTSANQILIEVQDSGLGVNVPQEKIHEIFHLYKRTHTHVQGKGLGLYLVKTQVEALRGSIEVTSARGTGSTFRVYLPMSNRDR